MRPDWRVSTVLPLKIQGGSSDWSSWFLPSGALPVNIAHSTVIKHRIVAICDYFMASGFWSINSARVDLNMPEIIN